MAGLIKDGPQVVPTVGPDESMALSPIQSREQCQWCGWDANHDGDDAAVFKDGSGRIVIKEARFFWRAAGAVLGAAATRGRVPSSEGPPQALGFRRAV